MADGRLLLSATYYACRLIARPSLSIIFRIPIFILNPTHSNPREALEKTASLRPDYSVTSQVYNRRKIGPLSPYGFNRS